MPALPAFPGGEFALIERILARLGDAAATDILVPPGDDGAAWRVPGGSIVATTDALAEGTHWRRDTMSMTDVGWRAVASTVSDLAAMGAEPGYLLVTAVLGPDASAADLDAFTDGLAAACRCHGTRVAGGDIVRGGATVFSLTAIGWAAPPAPLLRRDAARAGDLIAVSGTPGASAAGLALIVEHRDAEPSAEPLLAAHRRPVARLALGRAALAAGVRCAIDVSDGLLQDLGHVARRSGVGIEIDLDALPVHPAAAALLGLERARDLTLGGGEDYELVLAGPANALATLGTPTLPVTVIGRVVASHAGEVRALDAHGQPYTPPVRGWDQLHDDTAHAR